jgi:hypothetical protein
MSVAHDVFTYEEIQRIQELKVSIEANHLTLLSKIHKGLETHKDAWFFAGGYFPSKFHHEPYKDIDFYIIRTPQNPKAGCTGYDWIRAVMTDQLGMGLGDKAIMEQVSEYRSIINPKIEEVWFHEPTQIQFIFTSYTSREEVIKSFDYAHCCVSYYQDKLHISRKTYDAIRDKKLVVNNPASVRGYRMDKFIKRGWTVHDEAIAA